MIDHDHPLVKLAANIDWSHFDELFGATYSPGKGRPGVSTRLMVGLHYLKYTFDMSDVETLDLWVENVYWQYFCGMKYFEHRRPINSSSMTRWRKRIGESGAEEILKETIMSGMRMKMVKTSELRRINVDTTVQEKDIRFPTDIRLYDRARERLVKAAQKRDILLRQNYNRCSKTLLKRHSGYAHARQYKRARSCNRKLRTFLGRVIRDIERNATEMDQELKDLIQVCRRIHTQKRHDKQKIYSVHAPETECISKGKAHKRYEFGCKVSIAATSKGGWLVGAKAFAGNPYDGHTLTRALEQVSKISPRSVSHVFVDLGYRGHGYAGDAEVHVCKRRQGRTPQSLWRWMKRRSAIEATIGHLKQHHGMSRNPLKGNEGDGINALLSAAGMNFSKLRAQLGKILRLFLDAITFNHSFPFRLLCCQAQH